MKNKLNKVRVMGDFPGYSEGDILELDPNSGLFHFTAVTLDDGSIGDAFDNLSAVMADDPKQSIAKKEVTAYLGILFADISTYRIRTLQEINTRIDEIRSHIETLKAESETLSHLNKKEALTVWQNMLWEYEWILGSMDLYTFNTTTSTAADYAVTQDPIIENLHTSDYIDGNKLEQEDETDPINEDRESH